MNNKISNLFKRGYKYCGKTLRCIGVSNGMSLEEALDAINTAVCNLSECCESSSGLVYKVNFKGHTVALVPNVFEPDGMAGTNFRTTDIFYTAVEDGYYHCIVQGNVNLTANNRQFIGFSKDDNLIKHSYLQSSLEYYPTPPDSPDPDYKFITLPIIVQEHGIYLQAGEKIRLCVTSDRAALSQGSFVVYKD